MTPPSPPRFPRFAPPSVLPTAWVTDKVFAKGFGSGLKGFRLGAPEASTPAWETFPSPVRSAP
ncbi:hypothetical protein [Streptomyces mutabilis]|uniref:hypothetical protein n=1 Tax=Streptomyces mutabilis TaxID=67332 RepID=UPI0034DFBF64